MMRKLTAMIRDDPNDPWAREHTLSGRHEHVNYKLRLNYNMTWIKGRRPRQEDSHLAIRINAHISLFGVFDGHGGAKVSNRVSFLFPEVFKREIVEIKTKDYSADNLAAALRRSFAERGARKKVARLHRGHRATTPELYHLCPLRRQQDPPVQERGPRAFLREPRPPPERGKRGPENLQQRRLR